MRTKTVNQIRISLGLISAIISLGITTAFARDQVTVDASSFINKQRTVLLKQQQDYNAMLRKQEVEKQQQQGEESQDTSQQAAPTCDCDDKNDPSNYASNFVYDKSGQKTYRVNPYCQCIITAHTQSFTGVDFQGLEGEALNGSGEMDSSGGWNIQY